MTIIKISLISLVIVVLVFVVLVLWVYIDRSEPTPLTWTVSHLMEISKAINLLHKETGAWPGQENWKQQLKPYLPSYLLEIGSSEGYDKIFLDPWGSEIKYVVTEVGGQTKRSLYSFGPNRIDEKGKGDDIILDVAHFF